MGLDNPRTPLRSKLLAIPRLRQRYLANVHAIARDWLDWDHLGPLVAQYRELIDADVKADTRKLSTYEAFRAAVANVAADEDQQSSLRAFAEQRRTYLLTHPEVLRAIQAPK